MGSPVLGTGVRAPRERGGDPRGGGKNTRSGIGERGR